MPKSIAEKQRLAINAKNQDLLLQQTIRTVAVISKASIEKSTTDIHQPSGEIDFRRYNHSKKLKVNGKS
jgi:hypothetical protein